MMEILKFPDPRLKQETAKVEVVTPELRTFVEELARTMKEANGIGIAAIQVGRRERLFLVDGRCVGKEEPVVFINPELLVISDATDVMVEGCLSCPGVEKEVRRSKAVICRARDINFDVFEVDSNGLYARVIQHEFDHLYGKTIAE